MRRVVAHYFLGAVGIDRQSLGWDVLYPRVVDVSKPGTRREKGRVPWVHDHTMVKTAQGRAGGGMEEGCRFKRFG